LKPFQIYKKGLKYNTPGFGKDGISHSNCWKLKYESKSEMFSDDVTNGFMKKVIIPHKEFFNEILETANGNVTFVYHYY
jgi:hypothetical protein